MRGLVLVTPYDADTRLINRVTGNLGFGHAALMCSDYDAEDRPVAIDASFKYGNIQRRTLDLVTRCRPWLLIPIDNIEEIYDEAETRIGQPYNKWGLVGRHRFGQAATCSQLVYECIPPEQRLRVPCWRPGWCSPNDLYRAFGDTKPWWP